MARPSIRGVDEMLDVVLGMGDVFKSCDKKENLCWIDLYKGVHSEIKCIQYGIFITAIVRHNDDGIISIKNVNSEFLVKLPVGQKVNEIYISPYLSKLYILSDNNSCYVWSEPSKLLETLKNCDGEEIKVEKMGVGSKDAVIISKNNILLTVNVQGNLMKEIPPTFATKILSVSCGNEHAMLLSESGQILTFGCGSKGQLGHGSTILEERPKVVEGLDGLKIIHISAGGWHSAALSDLGDIYIWGWNKLGQLGLGDDIASSFIPQLVSFGSESNNDFSVEVKSVDCGTCHTIAFTDDGKAWGWGWNGYGQLGFNSNQNVNVPKLLPISETLGRPFSIRAQHWTTIISFCKTNR